MIAPSERGVALLVINAVFSTVAVVAYVLRFLNNLSRARKGSLPLGHFIVTDSLVFGVAVYFPTPVPSPSVWLRVSPVLGDSEWCYADRLLVEPLLTHSCMVLIVIAILKGGVGWDIDRLTPHDVGWALRVYCSHPC